MSVQQDKRACLELLEQAEAAYVTTVDGAGRPQTRAMFNLRRREQFPELRDVFRGHEEDFLLYFATNTSSRKVQEIRNNPTVAVYYCDPKTFRGLQLSGAVEMVSDPALKGRLWQDGWERYFPKGVDDPDYTVLRLLPDSATGRISDLPISFRVEAAQ